MRKVSTGAMKTGIMYQSSRSEPLSTASSDDCSAVVKKLVHEGEHLQMPWENQ